MSVAFFAKKKAKNNFYKPPHPPSADVDADVALPEIVGLS
jgi:hypothetical protein